MEIPEKVDVVKSRFWIGATNVKTLESTISSPKNYSFYWLKNGKNVPFALAFHAGFPDNPINENCLEVYKRSTGEYGCNDLVCTALRGFICQMNEC